MSSTLQPWLLNWEMRIKMIADALGGDVWVAEERLHWRPHDSNKHVSIPYRHLDEPFDPDEWVAAMQVAWEKNGVRL